MFLLARPFNRDYTQRYRELRILSSDFKVLIKMIRKCKNLSQVLVSARRCASACFATTRTAATSSWT